MDIDIFQVPGMLRRRLHYLVLSVIACVALAALYLSTLVPLYRTTAEILLDPQGLLADRRDLFVTGVSPQEQSSLESQTYIVQSRDVLNAVIRSLSLTQDPYFAKAAKLPAGASEEMQVTATAAALLKHLKVERAGTSFVLSVTAEHPDPTRAALIANTVAGTYLDTVANSRSEANRRAGESFQAQASELRDRVLKAEMAVETFREKNGLVATGEKGLLIDQQVAGINEQLTQARLAEEQQKARYDQARNLTMSAIEAGAIPEVAQSQSIELLRSRYTQLLEREAELAAGLGASHPQMRAVRSQLAGMRQSIDAEIARLRESMRASYERAAANTKAIAAQLSKVTQTSYDSSAALTRMRQLESEAEAVRTLYKTFLTRAEELGQTQGVNTNNSHVISEAMPPASAPAGLKKVVLIAAALFGIALGSGLAVLRELLERSGLAARLGLGRRRESTGRTEPASANARAAALATPDGFEPAGMPLIAALPGKGTASGGLVARLRHRLLRRPPRESATETRRLHDLGVLRAVHFLLNTYGARRPVTLVFLSSGEEALSPDLVGEIAETLAGLRQSVAFAPGTLAPQRSRTVARRRATGLAAAHAEAFDAADESLPLADRLVYRILPQDERPSHARFLPGRPDFALIDACGTDALDLLPALIAESDGLVLVDDAENASAKDMDELLFHLEPWKEKIAGRIVIGKRP